MSDDEYSAAEQWDEDQIVEQIESFRSEYGISYFIVRDLFFESFAPIVKRMGGK